jgi:hypothetical protein
MNGSFSFVKCLRGFGTNHHNLRAGSNKLFVVMAQLRHVPLAEWSGEAAVQDENYMAFAFEIG